MASQLSLGCLPNEVKDLIFAHLGWEVREFIIDRATSSSAYQALWPVVCRELPFEIDRGHSPSQSTSCIRHHMTRSARIHNALRTSPKMSFTIAHFVLAVPAYIQSITHDHVQQAHIRYVASSLWHNILLRLDQLRRLRLVALRIRGKQAKFDSTRQRQMLRKPAIPACVEELIIEDVFMCDCKWPHEQDEGLTCDISNVADLFQDFQDIKSLQTVVPRLAIESINNVRQFSSMKGFRVDVTYVSVGGNEAKFEYLFGQLSLMQRLRSVDLRFPWLDGEEDCSVLARDWTNRMPHNIQVVRIPLVVFFPAFEQDWSDWSHTRRTPLQFEVLFDRKRAVDSVEKRANELQKRPEARRAWLRDRLDAIDAAVQLIDRAQKCLASDGSHEMRSLKLVECEWSEAQLGPAWFEDEQQENTCMKAFWRLLVEHEDGLDDDRFYVESDDDIESESDSDYVEDSDDADEDD